MSPSSCLRSSLAGFTRPSRLFRPYSTQGDHYDILVPSEPYIFGVEHIKPRKVPSHILRPPYVTKAGDAEKPSRSACIVLGGGDERKLRSAARLARVICDFAGTLVKV
jgi:methionyl aminopeptidase